MLRDRVRRGTPARDADATFASPPNAAAPAEPVLAAAAAPQTTGIPITSKSPQAVEEFKIGREQYENMRPAESLEHFKRRSSSTRLRAGARLRGIPLARRRGARGTRQGGAARRKLAGSGTREHRGHCRGTPRGRCKVAELTKKLAQLAPGDWRAHWYMGTRSSMQRRWDEASTELKKAVELNPKAGTVYNQLGYAYLMQGKKDEAVAAFKNYAEAAPTEPNAHDSLADALLAANKLDEAEVEYKKALEVSPQFWFSWGGIAATHALRADWKGAYEALASAAKAAPRPSDRLEAKSILAWTQFSEGKTADALETVATLEKEAEAGKQPVNWPSAADRVGMLIETGKTKDALKKLDEVIARPRRTRCPARRSWRCGSVWSCGPPQRKARQKDDLASTLGR
jgi:tetratricopeptide (TPR) repeat protein